MSSPRQQLSSLLRRMMRVKSLAILLVFFFMACFFTVAMAWRRHRRVLRHSSAHGEAVCLPRAGGASLFCLQYPPCGGFQNVGRGWVHFPLSSFLRGNMHSFCPTTACSRRIADLSRL